MSDNKTRTLYQILEDLSQRQQQNRTDKTIPGVPDFNKNIREAQSASAQAAAKELDDTCVFLKQEMQRLEKLEDRRNTCTYSEYKSRWLTLHYPIIPRQDSSGNKTYDSADLTRRRQLARAYNKRFNIRKPIKIVADTDPTEVLTIIPEQVSSAKSLISGNNNEILINARIMEGKGRADVERAYHEKSKQIIRSVLFDEKELERRHIEMLERTISVFRLFDPDHPFLQQVDAIMNEQPNETPGQPDSIAESFVFEF